MIESRSLHGTQHVTPRIAILTDFEEDGWASMDHYAAMLVEHLPPGGPVAPSLVRPRFRARLARMRAIFGPRHGMTLDRYLNRFWDYPRSAARLRGFDLYHVVDQTYAHLVRRLPAGRAVVTCHDLDFSDPPPGTRYAWLVRACGAIALPGLSAAARVLCDSEAIRAEIVRRGLVEPSRLAVVPLGVESHFAPDGPKTLRPELEARLAGAGGGPLVLHVGAIVPRKRIDTLLRAFAALRARSPGAVLARAGGALTPAMSALAGSLGITTAFVDMPFLTRDELAALFRRADLFLFPSESEGFGLPVLEAMASGVPVVARDNQAVREVAGDAARLVAGDDAQAHAAAALETLADPAVRAAMRERGLTRAAGFPWTRTAEMTGHVYRELLREASA